MSRNTRRRYLGHVQPANIQISLHIPAVRSYSSIGPFWIAKKDAEFVQVDNKDSYQTAWTRRLI